jgi:hypothetical protein
MKITSSKVFNVVLAVVLLASVFAMSSATTTTGTIVTGALPYDPWVDINDDGIINIKDAAQLGALWGARGTPITKASLDFDSGWINITDMAGQYITITHNLGSMDGIVDITGKTSLGGGVHQRYLGGTDFVAGWNKTYGGTGNDVGSDLVQTVDGGYALAGNTVSFGTGGSYDFWLVKTDASGTMQWNKTYGGTGFDWAYALVQTNDGGYALAGSTGWDPLVDLWLVKTDAYGNQQWNKTYGGTNFDSAFNLVQTIDGGYALAGTTRSYGAGNFDVYLVKTDSAGNMQWNKTYGGTGPDWASALVQMGDGGYALAGGTQSFSVGSTDFWLIKTDASGTMQWNKSYGGTGEDSPTALVWNGDDGYAIAGATFSFGAGGYDGWVVKTDSNGNMQWNKTYGGTNDDSPEDFVQTADGGYALAGRTTSFGAGEWDFWLVKTDASGTMQWNKTYGGGGHEHGFAVLQTGDGGYALAGLTASFGIGSEDAWLGQNPQQTRSPSTEAQTTTTGTTYEYAYGQSKTHNPLFSLLSFQDFFWHDTSYTFPYGLKYAQH